MIVAWWHYLLVRLSKAVVLNIFVVITSWLEVAGATMAGRGQTGMDRVAWRGFDVGCRVDEYYPRCLFLH